MQPPCRLDFLQFLFEPGDAIADQAAVGLDLRLARSAHETKSAALALEMSPRPHQTAALVVQVRQFDLKRSFFGFGAAPEDFENESGAIEDLGVPGLLQVALLDRRQRAVHDHEFGLVTRDETCDLLDLTLAEIGRGRDLADRRYQGLRNRQVDGARQPSRLFEARLGAADDMGFLARFGIAPARS